MHTVEIVVGMLAAVVLLAAVAGRVGVPHAPVLVLGGLAIGLIPGVPVVHPAPGLVLFGFIPPLVYAASFRAASFDLRPVAPQILTLATGLVLLTVAVVAAVGHVVVGLSWPAAVTLGALAAPTDPVSATSVVRSVGAPERILAILEGESLINDGTGLAMFQVAVAAAAGGISVGSGALRFVGISLGGCAVGAVTGWLLVQLRSRLDDAALEIALGLLAAFGGYVAASALGVSGVLAAVTAGLYSGWRAESLSSAPTRLQIEPFWEALTFLAESLLFLLIGLQLRSIVALLPHGVLGETVLDGGLLVAVAVLARCAWMVAIWVLRRLPRAELAVLAAGGMRGALSLAGALSIPLLAGGHPFAGRDQIIFLVYVIVIGTLVLPSLGLERLIRALGLVQDRELRRQEVEARRHVLRAALSRLGELEQQHPDAAETIERLRATLELRLARIRATEPGPAGREQPGSERDHAEPGWLRRELISAERAALAQLRARRVVSARVLARIQRDIDLDDAR